MKQSSTSHRGYKTLPSAFRRSEDAPRSSARSPSSPIPNGNGGLLLGGISNLITGGMHFFGQLGRRKASASSPPPPRSSSASDKLSLTAGGGGAGRRVVASASDVLSGVKERFGTSTAASACVSELIEMASISHATSTEVALRPVLAEGDDGSEQVGIGHLFKPIGTFNPTWCDMCRELVWGLYDTGASRCVQCHLTCHLRCQLKIRLNCVAYISFNELTNGTSDRQPLLQSLDNRESSLSSSSSTSSADELDRDESTLANISTLREEEVREVPSSKDGEDESSFLGVNTDEESDDDDHKTLRDVSAIDDFAVDDESEFHSVCELDVLRPGQKSLDLGGLKQAIEAYNRFCPPGQSTTAIAPDDGDAAGIVCRGYIRVSMNLRRPIHVLHGTRPPSVYNLTKDSTATTLTNDKDRTLTSFYLPQDTVKALHLTSLTTVCDVIRALLGKFRVVDNPHKFALYEKNSGHKATTTLRSTNNASNTLGRHNLRKMHGEERPLLFAMSRCLSKNEAPDEPEDSTASIDDSSSCCYFVLQENDPGEICWESFSLPELKNFLRILDREEAWYKKRIHEKYELIHQTMQTVIEDNVRKTEKGGSTP